MLMRSPSLPLRFQSESFEVFPRRMAFPIAYSFVFIRCFPDLLPNITTIYIEKERFLT